VQTTKSILSKLRSHCCHVKLIWTDQYFQLLLAWNASVGLTQAKAVRCVKGVEVPYNYKQMQIKVDVKSLMEARGRAPSCLANPTGCSCIVFLYMQSGETHG